MTAFTLTGSTKGLLLETMKPLAVAMKTVSPLPKESSGEQAFPSLPKDRTCKKGSAQHSGSREEGEGMLSKEVWPEWPVSWKQRILRCCCARGWMGEPGGRGSSTESTF